ncbi:hypothetical protein ABE85_04870 [Mitsuaria sp. 7]|nr:hypothetical protein ABE85_04870 [Mitsuaria sp. 7]
MLARDKDIARRVKCLITVATPHFGSPVANAVLKRGPLGLPNPTRLLTHYFAEDLGALKDLRVRKDDYPQDENVDGVKYFCVGCDGGPIHRSPVFALTASIGGFGDVRNDGVVSLESASLTNHREGLRTTWPVDHGGAIGWPSGVGETTSAAQHPPPDHQQRYEELLGWLLEP